MNAAISPCVGICRLDDETGYCIGCGRTGDEIATWSTAGPGGRRAIWAALPARLDVLGVAVRRLPWGPAEVRGFVLKSLREGRGEWRLAAPGASAAFSCPPEPGCEIHARGDTVEAIGAEAALRLRCGAEVRAFANDAGPAGGERIVLAVAAGRSRPSAGAPGSSRHRDGDAIRAEARTLALRLVDADGQGAFWGIRECAPRAGAAAPGADDAGDAGDAVIATALGRIEVPLARAGLGAEADPAPPLPEGFVAAAVFQPEPAPVTADTAAGAISA
jgi:predicted Fe-S protein YdhL (DUF1289 family)